MSRIESQSQHGATISAYIIGFILALALTGIAFWLVMAEIVNGYVVVGLLLSLAVVQTIVQLAFFLHLGREEKPRWNAIFLFNTVGIIILIVVASIWIMNSLNNRMMSPAEMEKYVIEEGSKGF